MMAAERQVGLIERLPSVRGRYEEDVSLAKFTWFRAGGPAEVVFHPADEDDLVQFLKAKPADVPVTVIGVCSNLLIRDGGIDGVVIRLGRPFATIDIDGPEVRAGAAALDINVARACADAGVAGFEFLIGVPGTIGGALRMNAGAYDRELSDVAVSARAVTPEGEVLELDAAALGFSYRHCAAPAGLIFLSAHMRGDVGDPKIIQARVDEIREAREATQPIRTRTGGSTFTNPGGVLKAWQLIEQAGCRGLMRGSAQVSAQHCNFLINTGSASAADIEALGEEVRRRVAAETGVTLEWEIRRIGRPLPGGPRPAGRAGS
jgi:UDP-N-acetylmuramate dehydrogenase